jgi:hypothetical protein
MSDSDSQHRRPAKNGIDHHQNGELRALRGAIEAQKSADIEAHAAILAKLGVLDRDLLVTHVRDEERSKSELRLRRQLAALTMLFLSILAGLIGWAATEFRDIHRDIANNTAHFREFQAIGIEWGDNLDLRDLEIKEDIRQLRRLVNEHQRNKSEHAH